MQFKMLQRAAFSDEWVLMPDENTSIEDGMLS